MNNVLIDKYSGRQLEMRQAVLDAVIVHIDRFSFPPTYREIRDNTDVKSTCTIHRYLNEFQDLGLLGLGFAPAAGGAASTKGGHARRCISLNWGALSEMGLRPPGCVPILGQIVASEPVCVDPRDRSKVEGWVKLSGELPHAQDDLFALRVSGYSMRDACVLPGDIVVLQPTSTAAKGDMLAVWLEDDDETTLKYFFLEGDKVRLQPANPDFDPILRPADKVHVQGKVIQVIRRPGIAPG
jgi:repressor LexA